MPAMSSFLYENPSNPWEIIPGTPWGDIPAWMASTLATGTMGAFDSYMQQFQQQFDQFRADAVTETDSLLMLKHEVDAGMKVLRDVATTLSAARRQLDEERAEFEQRRADADKFAEPISAPPPTGDLHDVAPVDPEQKGLTDQGALPRELEEIAPGDPGTDPILPSELAEPPLPPAQPVSVSLNKDN
jgi:hypothetical protein